MQHIDPSPGGFFLCKWNECRGCEASPRPTDLVSAEIWLRGHASDLSAMTRLRAIVAGEGVGAGSSRLSDDDVVSQVAQMLTAGTLLVCGRRPDRGDSTPENAAANRVLRGLPDGGREFMFEGRRYRFVRADQWQDPSALEQYRIVLPDLARALIDRMAEAATAEPAKRALKEASAMLARTDGLRAGTGLLLLSFTPEQLGGASPAKAALTPSQLAQAAAPDLTWVELELVDDTGVAIAGAKYLIVGPDGQEHPGTTDGKGRGRVDGINPGQCKISFPGMDKEAWTAA